jgi:hypothetical protein
MLSKIFVNITSNKQEFFRSKIEKCFWHDVIETVAKLSGFRQQSQTVDVSRFINKDAPVPNQMLALRVLTNIFSSPEVNKLKNFNNG